MILKLFIGSRRTDISVQSDPKWPNMWRVHEGARVSDMVNLTRAKDAAIAWAKLPGGEQRLLVRWEPTKTVAEPSPVRQSEAAE